MIFVALGAATLTVVLFVMNIQQWRARTRSILYARDMAKSFDVGDRAGQAYSDMSTVIVLDGKAPKKRWAREWTLDEQERMFAASLISLSPEICNSYTDVIHAATSQYIRFRDGVDPLPEPFQTASKDL